jgi:hypothetical protein
VIPYSFFSFIFRMSAFDSTFSISISSDFLSFSEVSKLPNYIYWRLHHLLYMIFTISLHFRNLCLDIVDFIWFAYLIERSSLSEFESWFQFDFNCL